MKEKYDIELVGILGRSRDLHGMDVYDRCAVSVVIVRDNDLVDTRMDYRSNTPIFITQTTKESECAI